MRSWFETGRSGPIGVELFELAKDFDPDQHTIVRVAANEVRKKLAQHYLAKNGSASGQNRSSARILQGRFPVGATGRGATGRVAPSVTPPSCVYSPTPLIAAPAALSLRINSTAPLRLASFSSE